MKAVFADTHYFLARLNPADSERARVMRLTRDLRSPLLTTEWVLTEVADALSQPRHRPAVVRLHAYLAATPSVTIVPSSHELFLAGLDLFGRRLDKDWSLTDCISFVVMQQQKIHEALTADHHFAQAGFVALLA